MTSENKLAQEADTFYAALLEAHNGLHEAESHALNARLVLMLANEVGDITTLQRLLAQARRLSAE